MGSSVSKQPRFAMHENLRWSRWLLLFFAVGLLIVFGLLVLRGSESGRDEAAQLAACEKELMEDPGKSGARLSGKQGAVLTKEEATRICLQFAAEGKFDE